MSNAFEDDSHDRQADYEPPKSADELLTRYAAGERYFGHTYIPEGSDVRNATLEGANFEHSMLSDIDFRGSDLRNANLRYSNVKSSDFRGADLSGAIFTGASIEAADFESAKLVNANFGGAFAYGYELKENEIP